VSTSGSVIRTFGHNNNNYNRLYGNIFNVQGTGSGINVTIASLNYWNSDGNLFNLPNGFVGEIAGIKYQTLSAWQVGSGLHPHGSQDMNSVSGDPKFVSATDRHLTPASPGLHKAVLYAGRHEPVEDREGWLRGTKQDIGAYEMTAYRHYAQGCPGSGSQIPELEIGGNVAPGENISLDLTNGLANRTAALALGVTAVSVPLGTGCNLLVNPVVVLFAQTSASGAVSLPTTIPAATPIVGLQVHLQGGVSDAAANGGLAFTAGVTVRM
jgi:hypothetical protein